jgi:hypothetical protein
MIFLVPLRACLFWSSLIDCIECSMRGSDKNELTAITRYGILSSNKKDLKKVVPQNRTGFLRVKEAFYIKKPTRKRRSRT